MALFAAVLVFLGLAIASCGLALFVRARADRRRILARIGGSPGAPREGGGAMRAKRPKAGHGRFALSPTSSGEAGKERGGTGSSRLLFENRPGGRKRKVSPVQREDASRPVASSAPRRRNRVRLSCPGGIDHRSDRRFVESGEDVR
jgi:hypothetical protein